MSVRKPKKRKQGTESDPNAGSDTSSPTVTRSAEYWIDDGNVVLQAENTQYRVHRSLLARQSAVFADMFSLPQPPQLEPGESLVDGCPLVHLHDSAEDIGNLLDLLYESLKLHTIEGGTSISVIGTMLRIGRKYDFTSLWERGVSLLQHAYPNTMKGWDHRPESLIADKPGVVFDVIVLVHENDLKSILPQAYLYMFLNNTLPDIHEGFTTRRPFLSLEDLVACLMFRERLHNEVTGSVLDWLYNEDHTDVGLCDFRERCSTALAEEIKRLFRRDVQENLAFLTTKWSDAKLCPGLCKECVLHAKDDYEEGRFCIWENLPGFLRVI